MERTTLIICTLAEEARAASLWRAIESVRANTAAPQVLVVVNGRRHAPSLLGALKARRDIELLQLQAASLPAALLAGRLAVRTPFFSFLDDDDEYLPGAIDARLRVFDDADVMPDMVVSNGYRHRDGADALAFTRLSSVPADPLGALLRENWLASCGGLFRSAAVDESCFRDIAPYLEWTWLGYTLALRGKQIAVLDTPTFRIHDTADSASKSEAYCAAQVEALRRMLHLAPNASVLKALNTRLARSHHALAALCLDHGALGAATRHHLHSMRHLGGLRYLSFSRHLLNQLLGYRRTNQ